MFGNLSQARANLALQFAVLMLDERGQVRNRAGINHHLRKLGGMLGNVIQGTGSDALQAGFRFLNTKDKERNGTGVHNSLSEV